MLFIPALTPQTTADSEVHVQPSYRHHRTDTGVPHARPRVRGLDMAVQVSQHAHALVSLAAAVPAWAAPAAADVSQVCSGSGNGSSGGAGCRCRSGIGLLLRGSRPGINKNRIKGWMPAGAGAVCMSVVLQGAVRDCSVMTCRTAVCRTGILQGAGVSYFRVQECGTARPGSSG